MTSRLVSWMIRGSILVCLGLGTSSLTADDTVRRELEEIGPLIEAGRLAEAESQLRRLLDDRDAPQIHDLLGVVLSRQQRYDDARRHFQTALSAAPDLQSARQHLARLWLLQKRPTEALEELRRAAASGPLERDLAMTLGTAELAVGRIREGEEQLFSVADRFDSVRALVLIARQRDGRGDHRGALEALGRALAQAPSSEEALRLHAHITVKMGSYARAVSTLEALTRMHPEVADYAYLTGLARLKMNQPFDAGQALETARRLRPTHALTLIALGVTYNGQKRYEDAKAVLTESLRLAPDDLEALAGLAEAEEGLSELVLAEEHALRALSKDPTHLTANLVLGLLRARQQRYGEAVDALLKVLDQDPDSSKAHYQLSLAYARLGDTAASERHLKLYRATREALETPLDHPTVPSGDRP